MANQKQGELASASTTRKHWSEDEARRILGELAASGESVARFARRRGLWPQRLWWWKKQLGEQGPPGNALEQVPGAPTFVPVVLRQAEREVLAVVELGGGVRLELRSLDPAAASFVALVVRALGVAP